MPRGRRVFVKGVSIQGGRGLCPGGGGFCPRAGSFFPGEGVFVQGRGSLFGGGLGPEGSTPLDRMTNISENITFPQLHWRVVTRNFAID